MRTDLASMNPGKAMAQASHASNQFVDTLPEDAYEMYDQWLQCNGFGTVLVLGVTSEQMFEAVGNAELAKFQSDIVHDPSYPLRDGDTTHYIPLDTCGYVFGDKDDPSLQKILGNFELHD